MYLALKIWFIVIRQTKHDWFIVIRQTKHDSNAVYYFTDPTNVGCFFVISLPPSADSAYINIRDLTQNMTATATRTSLNKRFNEKNCSCARAL